MSIKLASVRLVCVIWDDAHGASAGDYSPDEIARDFHAPVVYTTFGLLVQQDDNGITLAGEHSDDESSYRNLAFIPAKMVKEVIDLGVPARKQVRNKKSRVEVTPNE